MNVHLDRLAPHALAGARLMLWIFCGVALVIFAIHGVLSLVHPYPLDYGEAPLVDQAMRLGAGRGIYRRDLATPPYTISNYPPLYVLTLVPFVKLFGPAFWYGRAVTLLCTLASALFLGLTLYTHTEDRVAAWVSGLMLLAIPYVVQWSGLLRIDLLALALSTAALYTVSRWPRTRRGLIVTGLLLVAAVYTRQSYGLAAPMAAFAWLWAQDRRQALRLAALVAGVGGALLLLLNLLTGGGFVFNIFTANVNPFQVETVQRYWRELRQIAPFLLIFGGAFLVVVPARATASKHWWLLAPYLVGATLSAATVGKVGSNVNYLLELSAALSLTAGATLALVGPDADGAVGLGRRAGPWLRVGALILLALQVGLLMRDTLRDPVQGLKSRRFQLFDLEALAGVVEDAEDPVIADEYMGMLTLHGRSLYLQPFEMTQLANAGLWDPTPLLEDIREQTFPLVLIHHFMSWPVYKERWAPEMLDAVTDHYAPTDFLAETLVYRPLAPGETSPADLAACPDAPWRLPTQGELGMWWLSKQLAFMGEGYAGTVPVYAVADGQLLRGADWDGAVAIAHDDPLAPGERVWTFYAGMASADGRTSFIAEAFPPDTEGVPVTRGQLLGYQGRRWEAGGIWPHARFAVVPALPDGGFPGALVGLGDPAALPYEIEQAGVRDPSPYLGTIRSQVMGEPVWLPVRCQE